MRISEIKNNLNTLSKKTVKHKFVNFNGHNFTTLKSAAFFDTYKQTTSDAQKSYNKNPLKMETKFWEKPILVASVLILSLIGASEIYNAVKRNKLSVGDAAYKKSLLTAMGINPKKLKLLKSIAGKDEFLSFLKGLQGKKEQFSVGVNFQNAVSGDFAANLHIHSLHSDGQMSIKTILEQARLYANKYAQKHKRPFFIALTDHNTITQNIEALKIITKDPKKYKNLRVVLGSEISTMYGENQIHILAYNVNPFSKNWATLMGDKLSRMNIGIENAINNANSRYSSILSKYKFSFSFDDMAQIRPSVKTSPCDVNYSMKDYMQFRLLYADLVENNKPLQTFLEGNGVKLSDLNFATPKYSIPARNVKQPYWANYVDELKKYLKTKVGGKKANDLDQFFKPVNEDVKQVLSELEYVTIDRNSNMYVNRIPYENLENVLNTFEHEPDSVLGYAHPCLIYGKDAKVIADSTETRNLISTIFDKITERTKIKHKVAESYYQAYYNDNEMSGFKQFTENLAEKHGFSHSGSYDSHRNSIFTNNTSIETDKLQEVLTSKDGEIPVTSDLSNQITTFLSELAENIYK